MSNTNVDQCMSVENEQKFKAIRESMITIGFLKEVIILINLCFKL